MDTVAGVGVLDKAVAVLRAVADAPRSLAALTVATGLPRATAHRLAVALEAHGLLRRDADGRFDLGLELTTLGRLAAERFPLVELARPVLAEPARRHRRERAAVRARGSFRRCVLSLQSPHALRWIVPDGALLPLEVGSAGRVLSGELGRRRVGRERRRARARGGSVSAPVLDATGSVIAAVSLSGPIDRIGRAPGRRTAPPSSPPPPA
jgi:DNA-binding IclR family transcriptional regulator